MIDMHSPAGSYALYFDRAETVDVRKRKPTRCHRDREYLALRDANVREMAAKYGIKGRMA